MRTGAVSRPAARARSSRAAVGLAGDEHAPAALRRPARLVERADLLAAQARRRLPCAARSSRHRRPSPARSDLVRRDRRACTHARWGSGKKAWRARGRAVEASGSRGRAGAVSRRSVGPKRVTVATPSAAARCATPVSPLTRQRRRASRRGSRPGRSRPTSDARPPAARATAAARARVSRAAQQQRRQPRAGEPLGEASRRPPRARASSRSRRRRPGGGRPGARSAATPASRQQRATSVVHASSRAGVHAGRARRHRPRRAARAAPRTRPPGAARGSGSGTRR